MGILLTLIKGGTVTSIVQVGGKEEIECHLKNMGFMPGASVTIISVNSGNAVVNVKESRVTINKRMANKITV